MTLQFTPFAVFFVSLYLVSGIVTLYVTILGWRHRHVPISRPFTLLMGALTLFIFAYIGEVLSPDLETSLFFNNIEIPCILTIPVAFLMIVLYHTGQERYVTLRTLPFYFAGVLVLSLIEFTNPLHYLYYTGFTSWAYEGLIFWIHARGPFFWVALAFMYGILLVSLGMILSHRSVTGPCHRRSLNLLLVAALVPIVFNIVCTFWITPFTGIDLTPMSLLIPGLIMAFGLFRYLFSTVPVAYTQVLATMQDGVIITDASSRVLDLNAAAQRMAGVRLRDAVGREIGNFLPALGACQNGSCIPETGCRAECTLHRDGEPDRYLDIIALPLGEKGASSEGTLFVLRDITERKHSELALAEANRKISLLSGITRHDIRNQLMALRAFLDLSQDSLLRPAELGEYLAESQKIADTIDRQIQFTRDYENMGVQPPSWQDVKACVSRALAGLSTRDVRVDADPGSVEVFADPLLEKVFYNLIDNALRYGGGRLGTIRISSFQEESGLVLLVEDDGDGISREDKTRLFTKGFGRNTGLGLFLSQGILSITGITIAENGEPGRGARFELRVPAGKYRFRDVM